MANLTSALASHIHNAERRDNGRVEVAIWSQLRTRDGRTFPARICNISPGGMLVMTPATARDYSELDIELPAVGWKCCMSVWSLGDKMGLEFDPPLDPSLLQRFIQFQNKPH
ncbi:MAG: hypothetical protein RL367_1660 [Pseudomonadota bacterium]